jgi:hypothetical protein
MPMIEKPDNNNIIWYNGKSYLIDQHYFVAYAFRMPNAAGEDIKYIALYGDCQRNDQGELIALEVQMEPIAPKWIGLLEALDRKLSGEWHSGSSFYYKSKVGLATKEEAEQWIQDTIRDYYRNDTERYQFTSCVLNYDEQQSKNLERFFRHMS